MRFVTAPRFWRGSLCWVLFAIASTSVLQAGTGTLETPSFTITVDVRCPEGNVTCDDVTYVGKNKKTGESVKLTGKTAHHYDAEGTPTQFLGYIFKNKDVTYFVSEGGQVRITRGDEVLVDENGTWTW